MSVMKNLMIVGVGIGAGMVIANVITDGAVFEAASEIIGNVRHGVTTKGAEAAETVAESVTNAVDAAADVAENLVNPSM